MEFDEHISYYEELGRLACEQGVSLEDNPFEYGTDEWERWREGWEFERDYTIYLEDESNVYLNDYGTDFDD